MINMLVVSWKPKTIVNDTVCYYRGVHWNDGWCHDELTQSYTCISAFSIFFTVTGRCRKYIWKLWSLWYSTTCTLCIVVLSPHQFVWIALGKPLVSIPGFKSIVWRSYGSSRELHNKSLGSSYTFTVFLIQLTGWEGFWLEVWSCLSESEVGWFGTDARLIR